LKKRINRRRFFVLRRLATRIKQFQMVTRTDGTSTRHDRDMTSHEFAALRARIAATRQRSLQ
jgi:hypothetical protein